MAASKNKITFLLKKLKPFDYLLIIFLILGFAVLFRFLDQDKKWVMIKVITNSNVFEANSIKIGDYELDSSGKKIAVVENFNIIDIPNYQNTQFSNKLLILTINVLANTSRGSNQLKYKNLPLGVGSNVNLNLNSVILQAYLSEIEGQSKNKNKQSKILTIELYNQWPWLAERIKIGNYKAGINSDQNLEVISKQVKPTQVLAAANSELLSPDKVDITLLLKTDLEIVNDLYIFQNYNDISIGKEISFIIGDVQINKGIISNIE